MKFESLLKIYWLKGFFINKTLIKFSDNTLIFKKNIYGFSYFFFKLIKKRFEFFYWCKDLELYLLLNKHCKYINHFFIQFSPVFINYDVIKKYNILRLYFIKSYRGRCHLLGKPVKGQRSWSNGWTSFYKNTYLKHYLFNLSKNDNKTINFFPNKNKSILQKKKKKKSLIFKKIKKIKKNTSINLLKTWY